MTHSEARSRPAMSIDWKAAVWAGLIAGAVFMMLEMALVAMTGQSPWAPPRMMAAIVLGEGVLPPPATFDPVVFAAAMAVHMALSVLLAFILAFGLGVGRRGLGVALLLGGVFGLAVYLVNFYGFTQVFPWFAMARNLINIGSHIVFGVVAAWAYLRLARRA